MLILPMDKKFFGVFFINTCNIRLKFALKEYIY